MSIIPHPLPGSARLAAPAARDALAELLRQKPALPQEPRSTSRRRKLWELPHKCHCPVIGVCFGVDELRTLLAKVLEIPRGTSDYVLHTSAVGHCESRSRAAELLHKHLEKRYSLTIRKFAAARSADELRSLWRATGHGDTPGALWAGWSHPACDAQLEQEIYGDIHMLQHQVGNGARRELAARRVQQDENGQLRKQLAEARADAENQRAEKSRETRALGQRISELRGELAGHEACVARLTGQLEQLRQSLPDLRERQLLARRATDAEARAGALTARTAELEEALERWRELAIDGEATIRHLLATPAADGTANPPEEAGENLSGKCILCVGGRAGAVDGYRRIVEQRGGRFLHHDGGQEESLHRIDAALSAADLVVCQAGCISHNAYWRVKEQCKRSGKQCIFVKGAGISSFGRIVSAACMPAETITID